MSNENKKSERSWMSSTAMKLAMLATAATSLSSCGFGFRDVTVVRQGGREVASVETYSETNAAKVGLGYVQTAANLYGHLDNNRTAKDITRIIVNGAHGHHNIPNFNWGGGNWGHSCMPKIDTRTSRPVPIPHCR